MSDAAILTAKLHTAIRKAAPQCPADIWAIAESAPTADGLSVRLAPILEARLAAMEYEWTWHDTFCAPMEA